MFIRNNSLIRRILDNAAEEIGLYLDTELGYLRQLYKEIKATDRYKNFRNLTRNILKPNMSQTEMNIANLKEQVDAIYHNKKYLETVVHCELEKHSQELNQLNKDINNLRDILNLLDEKIHHLEFKRN